MKIHKLDQHDQLIHQWRELGLRDLHAVHVDFHCDMRGLLVDTDRQVGWRIPEIRQTFVERLAERFTAEIETRVYEEGSNELPLRMKLIPKPIYDSLQSVYYRGRLTLKRYGL